MKLRLLLFEKCNRNCPGCCNKDWNLKDLPIVESYKKYDEILLTGGEPLLNPVLIGQTVQDIKNQNRNAKIFLYTAKVDELNDITYVMRWVDGVTITLHDQSDVKPFKEFNNFIQLLKSYPDLFSLRLNIFKGIDVSDVDLSLWKVKKDKEWIKDCPLPKRSYPNSDRHHHIIRESLRQNQSLFYGHEL